MEKKQKYTNALKGWQVASKYRDLQIAKLVK